MDISIKKIIFSCVLSIASGISLMAMEERQPLPTEEVSLYAYLRIKNDATAQEIKAAYKTLEHEEIISGFRTKV